MAMLPPGFQVRLNNIPDPTALSQQAPDQIDQPIQQPQQPPTQPPQQGGYPMPQQEPDGLLEAHAKQTLHVLLAFATQIATSPTPMYQKVDFIQKVTTSIQNINHLLPQQDIRFQQSIMEQKQAADQQAQQAKTQREQQLADLKAQALQKNSQLQQVQSVQKIEQSNQSHQASLQTQQITHAQQATALQQQHDHAQQIHDLKMSHQNEINKLKAQQAAAPKPNKS